MVQHFGRTGGIRRLVAVSAALLAPTAGLAVADPAAADSSTGGSVQITSPTDGGGVEPNQRYLVTVTATGQAPANDTIQYMVLYVDGNGSGQFYSAPNCNNQAKCTNPYQITTQRWTGTNHTLQVAMTTNGGQTVYSPVETVHIFSPTSIQLPPPPYASQYEQLPLTGYVTNSTTGLAAAGASVTVHFAPAYGKASSVTTTTSSSGAFTVNYELPSNTAVTATVNPTQRWGTSSTTTSIGAGSEANCAVAHKTVQRGHSDTITCPLPGLPSGVATTLSYTTGKGLVTYSHSHSTNGKVTFSFKLKKPGKYSMDVTIAANKVYAVGGGLAKVTVK